MEELKPTEFDKSFTDFFLWGESIDRINVGGIITHIPFGSEEYSEILVQLAIGRDLTEEEINKLREYGNIDKEI